MLRKGFLYFLAGTLSPSLPTLLLTQTENSVSTLPAESLPPSTLMAPSSMWHTDQQLMAETTMQGSLYKYDEYYHSYCMSNSESSVAFEVAIFISCSCLSCSSTICIYQCKNFGVTSTLSRLHQYDEGMLPTRFLGSSLRCFLLYQKTYLTTFQAFQSQPSNKGTPS